MSDCDKFAATTFGLIFIKLPPKVVKYRSYKNFDESKFCRDLDQILIKRDLYKVKDPYTKLTNILYNTLEKNAPLKSKTVRGNQAPFINKELSKAIMEKSRLRNKHLKYPSTENFFAYKNIKNKCNNLLKLPKKKYVKDISYKGAATSKSFWNTLKPFIIHKGIQTNENRTIEAEKNEQIEVKGLYEKLI